MGHSIEIADFKNGSEAVLKLLIKEYAYALRFFAYKIVRDKPQAEDIVSESFTKLWTARKNFDSFETIRSYLYKITRNACLDYIGSLEYRMRSTLEIPEDLTNLSTDTLTEIINAELISIIHKELHYIPEKYALIFKLTYLEGMSTNEVCKELGISSNAVFTGKSKALSHLQKIMKKKHPLLFSVFLAFISS